MKFEKYLSRTAVIIAVVLFICIAFGSFAVYNHLFPMADNIKYPDTESVKEISINNNNGISITADDTDYGYIINNISDAQPTRIWSVNDFPSVKNYYTVEIYTVNDAERIYRYFVYADNSHIYIESPYEGVYITGQQFFYFVSEKFN